jgi:hypothetical protein
MLPKPQTAYVAMSRERAESEAYVGSLVKVPNLRDD